MIARVGSDSVGLFDPDLPEGLRVSYAVESVAQLDEWHPEVQGALGEQPGLELPEGMTTRRSLFSGELVVRPEAGPEVEGDR